MRAIPTRAAAILVAVASLALAQRFRTIPGVSDVLVPQDVDYPALRLEIDRERASQLGLSPKEVVGNVITALTNSTSSATPRTRSAVLPDWRT